MVSHRCLLDRSRMMVPMLHSGKFITETTDKPVLYIPVKYIRDIHSEEPYLMRSKQPSQVV